VWGGGSLVLSDFRSCCRAHVIKHKQTPPPIHLSQCLHVVSDLPSEELAGAELVGAEDACFLHGKGLGGAWVCLCVFMCVCVCVCVCEVCVFEGERECMCVRIESLHSFGEKVCGWLNAMRCVDMPKGPLWVIPHQNFHCVYKNIYLYIPSEMAETRSPSWSIPSTTCTRHTTPVGWWLSHVLWVNEEESKEEQEAQAGTF
jgi:hypothetical protein